MIRASFHDCYLMVHSHGLTKQNLRNGMQVNANFKGSFIAHLRHDLAYSKTNEGRDKHPLQQIKFVNVPMGQCGLIYSLRIIIGINLKTHSHGQGLIEYEKYTYRPNKCNTFKISSSQTEQECYYRIYTCLLVKSKCQDHNTLNRCLKIH